MTKTEVPNIWRSPKTRRIFRSIREGTGIAQTEAAQRIGVSQSKLTQWENNVGELTLEQLYKLGEVLDEALESRMESEARPTADGDHCKRMRAERGIGQVELARQLECSQAAISAFENGYLPLDAKRLRKLKAIMRAHDETHKKEDMAFKLLHRDIEASLRREVSELEQRVKDSRVTSLASLRPEKKKR